MMDFERRVIPTFGTRDLVLANDTQKQLQLVLNAGRTHKFMSAQWGFGGAGNVADAGGILCLICGGPGSGKTATARAIAYELGQPIKVSGVLVTAMEPPIKDLPRKGQPPNKGHSSEHLFSSF